MSAMDDVLALFTQQGWTLEKREQVGGPRSPNPTRVDVRINRKQRLQLVLYAWKVTGEGAGRTGTNYRIQTTRSHQTELLSEPGRLTLGFGLDRDRNVLAAFDGWTKRNTGSSSSVHIKRSLLDNAAQNQYSEDGSPWDSRVAAHIDAVDLLLPWIHRQQQQRFAPVEPLELAVDGEQATLAADLWDSAPAAWLRIHDQLVATNHEHSALVEPSIWAIKDMKVLVTTPGRNPRRKVTFTLRRHGRVKNEATLLNQITGSLPT